MARALRVISVERGLDPRGFALLAFGGAGPLHACALAEELGMTVVLVPRTCGVLSALGLALGDLRRDVVAPYLRSSDEAEPAGMESVFDELRSRVGDYLNKPRLRRSADLRYAGQSYELTVDYDDVARTVERFHASHSSRYGYAMDGQPVEFVSLRMTAIEPVEVTMPPEPPAEDASSSSRRIYVDGDWTQVEVVGLRNLDPGKVRSGPGLIELGESTCLVRPDWSAELDDIGTLVLTRQAR